MPRKQKRETAREQGERFKRDAQELINAGELNPTEADEALDQIVRKSRPKD